MGELLKVAYVTSLAGIGGGESSLINLIKGLDKKIFEKYVICPQYSSFTDAVEKYAEVIIIPFGHPIKNMNSNIFKIFSSALKFWNFLKKNNINIIHTNSFISTLFVGPISKLIKIPVIMTSHGDWDSSFIKNYFYYKFVKKILCVSKFVRDAYIEKKNPFKPPIDVVYLGVDINRFRSGLKTDYLRREFGIYSKDSVVSIIGRFQKIKGHEFFLDAAEIVANMNKNVKFLIVGSNQFNVKEDENSFKKVVNRVKSSDLLKDRVIFTGFRRDIPEIINLSEVIVCSSISETFGMIIVEAMSCGKPVVSTYTGAPKEIIENGINGYLIPPENSQSIANKVISLLKDKSLRDRIGKEARKNIERNFSLSRYIKEVSDIYINLIS